jgi:hypothetical protein
MKQILIILGIVLLAIALVVVYFERKTREQNHKIASMFSLVSSLAEELNAIKYKEVSCSRDPETIHIGNQLIDVSDDEMELIEEESSEAEEEEDEEDLSELDEDDLSEASEEDLSELDEEDVVCELDDVSEVKSEEPKKNIKVLKLDLDLDSEEKEKTPDFKKMNIGELRNIAVSKGIDGTKLKKNELIDLLSK